MDSVLRSKLGDLDPIHQLEDDLRDVAGNPSRFPRTARLQLAGPPQQAKKLVEEATELAIEAVRHDRDAAVNEAADLVYNLMVLLDGLGISLDEVCAELARRRHTYGIAAKHPKSTFASGERAAIR